MSEGNQVNNFSQLVLAEKKEREREAKKKKVCYTLCLMGNITKHSDTLEEREKEREREREREREPRRMRSRFEDCTRFGDMD